MSKMCSKFIIVFVFINSVFVRSDENIVKTSTGSVKGLTINVLNQTIGQFLGIPYAEPPVGSLRFAKPKPISKPIEGIIDATKAKNSCIQGDRIGAINTSEDCLTLNIWSPKRDILLKPVMFWIYGGGLRTGSIFQSFYNGSVLATHDVVLVSANYRLGYLGFLYGDEESAPGNVGFYDQIQALKWVRENIHLFGGDKNQITIFGQSAGSWSVSAHIISPLGKGLFKRAIMESGAHLYNKSRPMLTKEDALINAKQLAKSLNCTDDKQWLQCLRKVDAKLLLPDHSAQISPVDGTEFLPLSAQRAFISGNFSNDIYLMAGVVQDEGLGAASIFKILQGENFTKAQFDALVLNLQSIFHSTINKENLYNYYLDKVDTQNSSFLKKAFYDFFGDLGTKCSTYQFAKQFAKHYPLRNNYFYELTYQGKLPNPFGCQDYTMGVCHGADIEFVFGVNVGNPTNTSKIDLDFSLRLMNLWTNFAKTGYPGNPTETWPELEQRSSSNVKNLNPYNTKDLLVDPFKKNCEELWKDYFE